MKKVLVTSAAMLMAAGMFTAAQAEEGQPGVQMSGDARVRAIYRDKFDFGNSEKDAHSYLDSRIRLTMKGTAAGGAYAVGRIRLDDNMVEDNDTDSSGFAETRSGNVWVDKAYIGIPFSDSFTLEGGKYRLDYGNGLVINDLPAAGLRGIIKLGSTVEINPFIEWMSEGQYSSIGVDKAEDNDAIRYGLHVKAQANENWSFGALGAYISDDRAEFVDNGGEAKRYFQHDGWLATVFFNGQEGAFGLSGEFAYNDGNVYGFNKWHDDRHDYDQTMNDGTLDDGFGGFIRPAYTIDALTLALNLGFTVDGFSTAPGFGFIMAGYDHPLTVCEIGDYGDWLWAGLTAQYTVSEDLSLTGNLVYVSIDGNSSTGISSIEDAIEISAALNYSISKGANFTWYAGVLIPSFEDSSVEDDPAVGSYGVLEVKF